MTYDVYISNRAESDIRGIAEYITFELKSEIASSSIVEDIRERIYALSTFPYRNRALEIGIDEEVSYRITTVRKYSIIYSINERNRYVAIERVVYSSSDLDRVFKLLE